MLSFKDVKKDPKLFKAMTSLDEEEFMKLCDAFGAAWHDYSKHHLHKQDPPDESKGGRKPILRTIADKLFFILFYFKTYPLQVVMAYFFEMSQSQANYWIHTLSEVLKMSLERDGHLPQRIHEDLLKLLEEEAEQDMAIDGTERKRQRPKDNEVQKKFYSGKKKAHTVKNLIVTGINDRQIKYLGETHEGKMHDKRIADEEELEFPEGSKFLEILALKVSS